MFFAIKAIVSGRINRLLCQMIAYCECGTVEEDFYFIDDANIHWAEGDDQFDVVSKYVNFLTGKKTEYRKLLRLVYDLFKCCGSTCILRTVEIDTDCSSVEFICDQDSDDLYNIPCEIYCQLICFDEVQSISFSEL